MHACIASNAPRHSGALAPSPPPPLLPALACCEDVDLRKHEKAATKEGPQGPSRKSAMQGHARASWMFRSTCSGVRGAPSLPEEDAEEEASLSFFFLLLEEEVLDLFCQRKVSFPASVLFPFSLCMQPRQHHAVCKRTSGESSKGIAIFVGRSGHLCTDSFFLLAVDRRKLKKAR